MDVDNVIVKARPNQTKQKRIIPRTKNSETSAKNDGLLGFGVCEPKNEYYYVQINVFCSDWLAGTTIKKNHQPVLLYTMFDHIQKQKPRVYKTGRFLSFLILFETKIMNHQKI
jgi:hypothetical protein